jgi:hypothetical protein
MINIEKLTRLGYMTLIEDEDLGVIHEFVAPLWLLHQSKWEGHITDLRGVLPDGKTGIDWEDEKYDLTENNWVQLIETPTLTMPCNRTRVANLLDYLAFEGEDFEQNPTTNHIWNSIQIVRHIWNVQWQSEFVRTHLGIVLEYLIQYEKGSESEILAQAIELRDEYGFDE